MEQGKRYVRERDYEVEEGVKGVGEEKGLISRFALTQKEAERRTKVLTG